MSEKKNIIAKRLAGAYLSSVISISLMLLLVGLACLLLANAGSVSRYFKESMKVSVVLKQNVSREKALATMDEIAAMRFIRDTQFVSKEQGIEEMKELLGSDFLDVFETAPIPVSIDVTLKAEYVSADSLELVKSELSALPLVDEMVYQRSLVDALNANLSRISAILAVFIALMLFISFVLINNVVRLNVYARRFTVHTMSLVGATRAFIRKPFLIRAVIQGVISAAVAIAALVTILAVLRKQFVQMFDILRFDVQLMVMAVVLASGVLICVVSTYFVVNKLVSLRKADLYY